MGNICTCCCCSRQNNQIDDQPLNEKLLTFDNEDLSNPPIWGHNSIQQDGTTNSQYADKLNSSNKLWLREKPSLSLGDDGQDGSNDDDAMSFTSYASGTWIQNNDSIRISELRVGDKPQSFKEQDSQNRSINEGENTVLNQPNASFSESDSRFSSFMSDRTDSYSSFIRNMSQYTSNVFESPNTMRIDEEKSSILPAEMENGTDPDLPSMGPSQMLSPTPITQQRPSQLFKTYDNIESSIVASESKSYSESPRLQDTQPSSFVDASTGAELKFFGTY